MTQLLSQEGLAFSGSQLGIAGSLISESAMSR